MRVPLLSITVGILFIATNASSCGISKITIKDNKSLTSQIVTANATYIIKDHINLHGETIQLPEGCILRFDGGSLNNGTLIGRRTKIENKRGVIFNRIKLKGHFSGSVYLSWFKQNKDDTDNFASLLVFDKCHLDRDAQVRGVMFSSSKNITIDGHNNRIVLKSLEKGNVFLFQEGVVNISNLTIDCNHLAYDGEFTLMKISSLNDVTVETLKIQNYGNHLSGIVSSSFLGLSIKSVKENSVTIKNCAFEDCVVTGDGKEITGMGANYPLNIYSYGSEAFGYIEVSNCFFKNIYTIDKNGNYTIDDGSALYIQGVRKQGDIHIKDCKFENVSKRAMKLQCNYAMVENCEISNSSELPMDAVIGIQGGGARVAKLKAKSNGIIIQCVHGDDLEIMNSTIQSFNSYCITSTGNNVLVNQCEVEGMAIFHGMEETGEWYYGLNKEGSLCFSSSLLTHHTNAPVSTSRHSYNTISFLKCNMENVHVSLPYRVLLQDSQLVYSNASNLSYFIAGCDIETSNCTLTRDIEDNKYAFYIIKNDERTSSLQINNMVFRSKAETPWNIVQIQGGSKMGNFEVNDIEVDVPESTVTFFIYGGANTVDFNNITGQIKNYRANGNARLVNLSNAKNGIIKLDSIDCPLAIANNEREVKEDCIKYVLSGVSNHHINMIPASIRKRVIIEEEYN